MEHEQDREDNCCVARSQGDVTKANGEQVAEENPAQACRGSGRQPEQHTGAKERCDHYRDGDLAAEHFDSADERDQAGTNG